VKSVRLLAITTSTSRCGVALLDGQACAATASVDNDRLHAEKVFPLIEAALAEANWRKSDLAAVACDIGPGSFTGVRVGLASAKGIALALRLPIVGVTSLEAMAQAAFACTGVQLIAPMIDAKRGERFVAVYAPDRIVVPPAHVAVADIPAMLARHASLHSCGLAGREMVPSTPVIEHPSCELPAAEWIGRVGASRISPPGPDDLAAIEPLYLRAPDAVLPARPPDWRGIR
jgi:tRNA threonylcarbamoyladenosine biosynthesis protein TsaB